MQFVEIPGFVDQSMLMRMGITEAQDQTNLFLIFNRGMEFLAPERRLSVGKFFQVVERNLDANNMLQENEMLKKRIDEYVKKINEIEKSYVNQNMEVEREFNRFRLETKTEYDERITELESTIARISADNSRLQATMLEAAATLESRDARIAELEPACNTKRTTLIKNFKKEKSAYEAEIKQLKKDIHESKITAGAYQTTINRISFELSNLKVDLDHAQAENIRLLGKISEMQTEREQYEAQMEANKIEWGKSKLSEVLDERIQYEESQEENQRLRNEIDSLKRLDYHGMIHGLETKITNMQRSFQDVFQNRIAECPVVTRSGFITSLRFVIDQWKSTPGENEVQHHKHIYVGVVSDAY